MLTPKPLDPIPRRPLNPTLRPGPTAMWKEKPILKSRTIASIILTILVFVLAKFFGVDIDLAAIGVGAEGGITVGEIILLAGAIAAGFFRVKAEHRLNGVATTPDPNG